MGNKINFEVGLNLNQSQYNQIKQQLASLSKMTAQDLMKNNPGLDLTDAQNKLVGIKKSAEDVQIALTKAFNVKLGSVNIDKFSTSLKNLGINKIYSDFSNAGIAGKTAFRNITSQVLTTNLHLKETHQTLDKLATTMGNTVKWGVTSRIFNEMASSVEKAWSFTKELDTSLNNIRIVTGKSADEMERFARIANKSAQALGKSTKDYTDAALIYYQQGLSDTESQKRAEITLKTANVTGQSTETVSEQLTAVWNGYKVAIEDSEKYVDKLAAVAADTAADLEELSVGMSKVASAANIMGVDIDQLSATLATIISVTRQAPESVGTALKTIYARMGDIQAGIDTETTLDAYTQQMLDVGGINVLDYNNELRDMGDVIEEVGNKWSTMSREQQIALSQVMAGTRQYNNLLSLFDNWDMYTAALETSKGSLGELNRQQDIYMESTKAHLEQLDAAWERVFDAFVDNRGINGIVDIFTNLTNGIANFTEAIGGGGNALLLFSGIATKVFGKQISQSINMTVENFQKAKYNAQQLATSIERIEELKKTEGYSDAIVKQMVDSKQEMSQYYSLLDKQGIEQGDALIQEIGRVSNLADTWEHNKEQVSQYMDALTKSNDGRTSADMFDLKENSDKFARMQGLLESVSQSIGQSKDAWSDYDKQMKKVNRDSGDVANSLENILTAAEGLSEGTGLSKGLVKDLDDANSALRSFIKDNKNWNTLVEQNFSTKSTKGLKLTSLISDLQNKMKKAEVELGNNIKTVRQVQEGEFNAIVTKTEEYKQAIDDANAKWDEFIKPLQQTSTIEGIVGTAQGISMVASALMSLSNIGDIINNDDLTTWEKTLQIMMSLGTTIPLIVVGFGDLAKGVNGIKTAILASVKAQAMETAVMEAKEALIARGIPEELALAQAKTKVAAATNLSTAATWKEIAALVAKKALMIGGVLLAIGLVAAATYALVEAYNADANAAKAATENAEQLRNEYLELKQSAEELKETISNYNDAILAMKDLTAGTDEYSKSLKEANKQAEELIKTYGLYDKYSIKNGLILIDTDVLNDIQAKADATALTAEKNSYAADISASKAQLKSSRTDLGRYIGSRTETIREDDPTTPFVDEEKEVTHRITGETVEGIIGLLQLVKDTNKIEYERILSSEESFTEWIKGLNTTSESLTFMAEQVGKQNDEFRELTEETIRQAEAQRYLIAQINKIAIEELYGGSLRNMATDGNGVFDEAKYNQLLAIVNQSKAQEMAQDSKVTNHSIVSEFINEARGYLDNEFLTTNRNTMVNRLLGEEGFGIGTEIIGGDITSDQDLARKYLKYVSGMTDEQISQLRFTDGEAVDRENNVVLDYDSADKRGSIRTAVVEEAVNRYYDEQTDSRYQPLTEDFIDILNDANISAAKAGAQFGTDFSGVLNNAITSDTKEFDFSDVFDRLSTAEVEQMKSMSSEELQKLFGLTDQQLVEFGFDTAEKFATNVKAGLEEYSFDQEAALDASMQKKSEDLEAYGSDLTKKKFEELSEEVEIYAANLMEVAEDGKEVAKSMEEDSDAAVDFALKVVKMNRAIDTLADNFKNWKDILKNSSRTSEEYAEAMYGLKDAIADVYDISLEYVSGDFITEHLSEIEKIAKGDEDAIESLRAELAQEVVTNIAINNDKDVDEIVTKFSSIREQLESALSGIKVGGTIDDTELVNSLNKMIEDCGMSVEQANQVFSALGVTPTYESDVIEQPQTNPIIQTSTYTVDNAAKELEYVGVDGNVHKTSIPNYTQIQTSETIGYTQDVVKVPVTAIGVNGKQPTISGVKKAPGGSFNNYSKKNRGGKSPGSKSGGSSKANKIDKIDKKPDRYHKVDTQLTKIGNKLENIQSQEEKLTGAELIGNINAQLDQLNNRLDTLRDKMIIAQGETSELHSKLSGEGVNFNPDGTIANYEQIYNSKLNYVNGLIEKYNGMSADEQEKYKETVEKAKEDFEKFCEDLDRYDELVSDFIPGLTNEIQDAVDQQIELNIKKFNVEFDVKLDLKEATAEWNEFKKKIIDGIKDDDIYGNARARIQDDFTNLISEHGVQSSTKQVNMILSELKAMDGTGWSQIYGDNRTSALEELQEAYGRINDDLLEIDQIQQDVHQAWLDTMDEINDKMADQVSMYEQISNLITHDMRVIELVYGETDFEALGKYFDRQHQNSLGLLDFQRQNAEFWEKEMNSINKEADPDAWESARDKWIEAINSLNATIENSIDNAKAKMENAIDGIFDKFNKEITDGKGLDYLSQQWDLVNDNADDYLDTVNAAFGIRQLESKYQDAIDATDNVSAQRKLNDLMEQELKALREKDKLSEYDVERANMRYEIALKQIALEEAQQTKNTMRLRRDSQGNYRYEYVADEDAIGKLQDELDALENSLYNFDKNRWIEMQNEVVSAVQERQEAIKEILIDASLTEEERAARLAEINELYNEKIQNITEQTVTAQNNLYQSGADELSKLWDEQGKDFSALSAEQQRILTEEMLPQFETGVNQMIEKFAGEDGFVGLTTDSMEQLNEVTEQYNQDLQEIQITADTSFDNIESGIDKNIEKTQQLVEDNRTLNNEYEEQIKNIKELNAQLDEQIKKYQEITDNAKKATQAGNEYLTMSLKQDAKDAEAANNGQGMANPNTSQDNSNSNSSNTNTSSTSGSGGNGTPEVGEYVTYLGGSYYETSGGKGAMGERGVGRKVKITSVNNGAKYPIHVMSSDSAYGWLKKSQLSGYDTGGYTGDWVGNYGKLAILHNKELVLNSHDTENMLNMMQIARDVIASAGPRVAALSAGKGTAASAGQLEQNVHIEANFPNVESASEIEEALNNLVQLASQRASRNIRG